MRHVHRFGLAAGCFTTAMLVAACVGPTDEDEATQSSESALEGYSAARGNRIADRAIALWNGKPSRDWCLKGVGDTLESSGVVSPAFPRLPSAVAFDNWARANPGELARRGFAKMNLDVNAIPRGSIITWRPGQCGYHSIYGHVEIVVDGASTRACSDYCGPIRKNCGAPGIFVPVGPGGAGPNVDSDCAVRADKKLHCVNRANTPLLAEPKASSPAVNTLRTTMSWFECWGSGDLHAGGNTTWYRTLGDDNGNRGWAPAVALRTPDAFDADPTAKGLAKCDGEDAGP